MGNLETELNPTSETMDQIHWTADGKLEVTVKSVEVIESVTYDEHNLNLYQHYYYDGMGNRVLKIGNGKKDPDDPYSDPILIHCRDHIAQKPCAPCHESLNMRAYYYAREAGGKVLATYETTPDGEGHPNPNCWFPYHNLNLVEWYIYGSESDGRISTLKPYPNEFTDHLRQDEPHFYDQAEPYAMKDTIIEHMGQVIGSYRTDARRKGYKQYEIKDHLGNVRAVISDVKNPLSMSGSIDNWRFRAEIRNLSNYYPYGMQIPTGIYSSNADYTYGYNGMEKDDELKSGGKLYSTLFREGDTENGRWWSRDPEEMNMPYQSPYITMDANPIRLTDVYGNSTEIEKEVEVDDVTGDTKETYSFTLKAAVLNTSDVPINMEKFKNAVVQQLRESFNGSEKVYNEKTKKYETVIWQTVKIDVKVIDDKSELEGNEHLIEISDEYPNTRGKTWGRGGLQIYVTPIVALQTIGYLNMRTVSHEWGHTGYLWHPEEWSPTKYGGTPNDQNISDINDYPENLMRTSLSWEDIKKELNLSGNGNKLNANQVRIMYDAYKKGNLNNDDRYKWYISKLWWDLIWSKVIN